MFANQFRSIDDHWSNCKRRHQTAARLVVTTANTSSHKLTKHIDSQNGARPQRRAADSQSQFRFEMCAKSGRPCEIEAKTAHKPKHTKSNTDFFNRGAAAHGVTSVVICPTAIATAATIPTEARKGTPINVTIVALVGRRRQNPAHRRVTQLTKVHRIARRNELLVNMRSRLNIEFLGKYTPRKPATKQFTT